MAKKAINVKEIMKDIDRYLAWMHTHGRPVEHVVLTAEQYKAVTNTLKRDTYRGVSLQVMRS